MTRIGVGFSSNGLTPGEIVECVQLAEELRYDSAWMAEGHGGDQFAVLSACATATKRIRLGTSISSVFVRSAPTIAMAAATVDHLSGGRMVLGLGSSHKVQVEGEHGITFGNAIPRVRDTVAIVRALLRDGVVSHKGEVVDIEHFDLWFPPLRKEMPIYLAALFPKMLQIAGELAQGVLLTYPTLESGRRAAENVAIGAGRAGRRPEDIEIASLLPCQVAESKAEACERLRFGIAFYVGFFPRYNRLLAEAGFADDVAKVKVAWDRGDRDGAARLVPDALIDAVALAGTPAECREKIERYRASGIALPIVTPRGGGPDPKARVVAAIRACAP
ncbi:MAG TPA: LLM class flavin-dependent oxidoreductase [Methylomirabilota bacterium]|jgi:probable F420-dependent oxidoreductase|nr:LLM class flavin-dependent oxidoreductase [Methylomirabilota bacterium]